MSSTTTFSRTELPKFPIQVQNAQGPSPTTLISTSTTTSTSGATASSSSQNHSIDANSSSLRSEFSRQQQLTSSSSSTTNPNLEFKSTDHDNNSSGVKDNDPSTVGNNNFSGVKDIVDEEDDDEDIYDEIEIEDMSFDPDLKLYHYPCPCGDRFEIAVAELRSGKDIAVCPGCSLRVRVVFDVDDVG